MATARVQLTEAELAYLASSLQPQLGQRLLAPSVKTDGPDVLEIEPEVAKAVVEALLERFARAAFDADYLLTEEGAVIEALILKLGDLA